MRNKEIDFELAEFLTAPRSVQEIHMETTKDMWRAAWVHVAEENAFIEMRDAGEAGRCAYCTQCNKWACISHLLTPSCNEKVKSGSGYGPLLNAILNAASQEAGAAQTKISSPSI